MKLKKIPVLLNTILSGLIIIFLSNTIFAQNDSGNIPYKTITIEGGAINAADATIQEFIIDKFPIISKKLVEKIVYSRSVQKIASDTNEGVQVTSYNVDYKVPINFLLDTAKLLWELNIPEFRSHLYQIYNKDTIYIDTWNNVVGTAKNKTYTGYFNAYRVRNYPTWKDPEKGKENLPATPPGPNNPLGLFVVHYDENSLRYFHGTNKNHLLNTKMRSLSHGCVRNDNDNIAKMKEFIIKRVIKSADLSNWTDSKRSMIFEFAEIDKFPVRIIYKTFDVNKDDTGIYFELYDDIYHYKNRGNIDTKWNEESLITLSSEDNIVAEYQKKFGKNIPEETLRKIVRYVIDKTDNNEKYYLKDIENLVSQ
ncbi:MAG TPA: L,D-transpeptidase family protein [Ignavibacteria bacterium]